jgi:hypothetical protein
LVVRAAAGPERRFKGISLGLLGVTSTDPLLVRAGDTIHRPNIQVFEQN